MAVRASSLSVLLFYRADGVDCTHYARRISSGSIGGRLLQFSPYSHGVPSSRAGTFCGRQSASVRSVFSQRCAGCDHRAVILPEFVLLALVFAGAVPADAQLWKQFVPTSKSRHAGAARDAANAPTSSAATCGHDNALRTNVAPAAGPRQSAASYALTQDNGPWLIVAASFSGDGAEKQAQRTGRRSCATSSDWPPTFTK